MALLSRKATVAPKLQFNSNIYYNSNINKILNYII